MKTKEELQKNRQKLKALNTIQIGAIVLMAGISIYSFMNNGFSFIVLLPIFFVPIALVNQLNINKIDQQIKNLEKNSNS